MNRKTFTVAIIISALLVSMLFEISNVSFANATYTIHQNHTLISIQSPITNGSYAESTIPLVVNVSLIYGTTSTLDEFSFQNLTCLYSLDNGERKKMTSMNVTSNTAQPDMNYWNGLLHKLNLTYSTTLQDLTEGSHSVNITLTLADSWGTYQNSIQAYFFLTPNHSPSPTPTPTPSTTSVPSLTFTPIVSLSAQTDTTVTLVWTKTNPSIFGILGEYQVTYASSLNGSFSVVAEVTDWNQTSYTVTGLTPNSTYYFVIRYIGNNVIGSNLALSNTLQVNLSTPMAHGIHTESYALTIILLSIASIAIVLGVLVYFKKSRR